MPFVARTPRKAWARASTQHGLPSFVLSDLLLSTATGLVRSWERPVDEPVLHEVDEVQARRALSRTPVFRQRVWVLVDRPVCDSAAGRLHGEGHRTPPGRSDHRPTGLVLKPLPLGRVELQRSGFSLDPSQHQVPPEWPTILRGVLTVRPAPPGHVRLQCSRPQHFPEDQQRCAAGAHQLRDFHRIARGHELANPVSGIPGDMTAQVALHRTIDPGDRFIMPAAIRLWLQPLSSFA